MSEREKHNGTVSEVSDEIQRWTAKRRAAWVLSTLEGETTPAEAARKHDLTKGEIERWKNTYPLAAESAWRSLPKDVEALHQIATWYPA